MSSILLVSPERWVDQAVSKHHYARVLVQSGRHVLFLDPPSLGGGGISLGDVPGLPGLRVVRGPRVAPGLRLMPAFARRWLEARWLARLEKLAGTSVTTVWLFENSRFYDMGFAGDRLKIYHQVDLNQSFHPQQAARTSDVCLCTTDVIRGQLLAARPDVHKIHHATAIVESPRLDPVMASALAKPGKHAVCVGNMDMRYLDHEAIQRLVERHPDITFHFIGAYSRSSRTYASTEGRPNVAWWGRRDHGDIPAILAAADVLLVAYDARRYRDQLASPHKFMEYLLSGKTIVASYTDEYKDKGHLIEMAGPDEEIDPVFARVVGNLDHYNAPGRMAERRAFALDHSYERQLGRIEGIVRESTGREL
jgi:glycosyltransferase involved in cell wall biosynthesis